jgi:hypothetical protein
MRRGYLKKLGLVGMLGLFVVLAAAKAQPKDSKPKEPMFIRWLIAEDPGDETIRYYWQRAEAEKASAAELVDLGTMLFYRGYPKDAIRMFRRALDEDKKMYEAWFRIGLVEHREGNLRAARRAYRKCLKELTGHGWCNFYLGLLEEQSGHPTEALEYYRRAFKFAPSLADPKVNPELLYSELQFAAAMRHQQRERFTHILPMPYLQENRVEKMKAAFAEGLPVAELDPLAKPTPPATQALVPTPTPTPQPTLQPTPQPTPKAAPRRTGPASPGTTTTTETSPTTRQRPTSIIRRVIPTPAGPAAGSSRNRILPRTQPPVQTPAPRPGGGTTPTVPNVSAEAMLQPLWLSPLEQAATNLLAAKTSGQS